jgi:hypothetical protein
MGLPAPSVIRTCKIATIDVGAADPLGRLPAEMIRSVLTDRLQSLIG